jgi:hypothetical protein
MNNNIDTVRESWTTVATIWRGKNSSYNALGVVYETMCWYIPSPERVEIYKNWCIENIGSEGEEWYYTKENDFSFSNPQDVLAFKLTFGIP